MSRLPRLLCRASSPCRSRSRTAENEQNLLEKEVSGHCPLPEIGQNGLRQRLQGMTVVISPRGGNENLLARGQPHQRTQSLRSLDSPGAPPGGLSGRLQSGLPEVGTPGTAASAQDAGQQHIGTKWQETDEVACSLAGGGARGEEPLPERVTLRPGANTLWCEVRGRLIPRCQQLGLHGRGRLQAVECGGIPGSMCNGCVNQIGCHRARFSTARDGEQMTAGLSTGRGAVLMIPCLVFR